MNKHALAIISVSLLIGFTASFSSQIQDSAELGVQKLSALESSNTAQTQSGYRLGSAHEHAMFYVIVNGTELSFTEQKYQLAARHVHLENNRSNIVHKHAKGVTWNEFLDAINASINQTDQGVCANIKNRTYCGEGAVSINGESLELDKEISQGDRLVVVLQENPEQILEQYDSKQLPRAYKPEGSRGRRL